MAEMVSGMPAPQSSVNLPDPAALAQAFAGATPPQPQLAAPDWFRPLEAKIRKAEGTADGSGMVLYGGQQFTPGHDFPQWDGAQGPVRRMPPARVNGSRARGKHSGRLRRRGASISISQTRITSAGRCTIWPIALIATTLAAVSRKIKRTVL